MRFLITDLGDAQEVFNQDGKHLFNLPRYGVWKVHGQWAQDVIETSDDLPYLQKKYNTNEVIVLRGAKNGNPIQ